jgi:hypothetical protein
MVDLRSQLQGVHPGRLLGELCTCASISRGNRRGTPSASAEAM